MQLVIHSYSLAYAEADALIATLRDDDAEKVRQALDLMGKRGEIDGPDEYLREAMSLVKYLGPSALKPLPTPLPVADTPKAEKSPQITKERIRKLWLRGAVRPAWRPRRRGKPDKEVQPLFTMFPRYVNAVVRAAMSKSVLLAYIACLDEADLDGRFEMPAGQLGQRIGCNRRNAQRALSALLDAGLLILHLEGGPRTPNVYGLRPWREFDEVKTIEALAQYRQASADHIEQTLADCANHHQDTKAQGVENATCQGV